MNAQLQNNRPASPIASFNAFMQKHKGQLELALPKHLNADRMVRLSLTAFSQNSALQKCDPKTIFGSIIVASQLGLEIGVNGQGYLVPYKTTCTFVPGWKGLVDLANRGGRCTVWTGAVYEGDEFDYMLGDSPYCKHKPCGEFDESKLTHVYAIGRVKDSEMPVIEVWPVKKVHAHFKKNVVPALQPNHYSKKHFEAYAKKVALLQVLKYMPQSIELSNAMDVGYAAEQGKNITIDGDFVTVENDHEIETDSIQVEEIAPQLAEPKSIQQNVPADEENVKPTFAMIKHSILTAKSPAHLEFCEEQALDHDHSDERKQLMQMVRAQREKFTPVVNVPVTATQATEVAEPQEVQPEQPKKLTSAEMRRVFLQEVEKAADIAHLDAIVERVESDTILTDSAKTYLINAAQQKMESLKPKAEKSQQATKVDPNKSKMVLSGILTIINECNTLDDLVNKAAQSINDNAARLIPEHLNDAKQAYAVRKHFLENQVDMFAEVDEGLSYADAVIKRIQNAQSQDDINAEYADPAFDTLPEEDVKRIDAAAAQREKELQG